MKENGELLAVQLASAVQQEPTIELVTPQKELSSEVFQGPRVPCAPTILPPGPRPCAPDFTPRPTPCLPACSPAQVCSPSFPCMPNIVKPPPKPPGPH